MSSPKSTPSAQNQSIPLRFPQLNFVEWSALAKTLSSQLAGARVDRVFVPALPEHPGGYAKQEWCIDFYSNENAGQLFFSLRPQACGLFVLPPKTLKVASQATRSGFDLGLVKHLQGLKLKSISAIANERIVEIKLGPSENEKVLLLYFIPARPEAVLFSPPENLVLNRTKEHIDWAYPIGRDLPAELQNKFSLDPSHGPRFEIYSDKFLEVRTKTATAYRKSVLEKLLRERIDYWSKKEHSFNEQLNHSNDEPDWAYFGSLLQMHFHAKPTLQNGSYLLTDYEKGVEISVPGDQKLTLKQQLEYYFHQAKRAKTRIAEAHTRGKAAAEKVSEFKILLDQLNHATQLPELLTIELALGLGKSAVVSKAVRHFGGKQFLSVEGLTILVGRNSVENLELTFKIARGNDLWLHVRGRPGAHVVILIPPKKSASLDTLLDAAHLCIHYSGGKEWGKTEVDYAPKKMVKKIKNQTEVSYSGNKTLMVTPDPVRIKRLLGEQ